MDELEERTRDTRLAPGEESVTRIPIVEEQAHVGKRVVETEHVRVRTLVEDKEVVFRESVARGHIRVERVPRNVEVYSAPQPREEGDLLIVPVTEERLVVEKRLFLVEELHIHRSVEAEAVEIPVSLRTMRAVVERDDPQDNHRETR